MMNDLFCILKKYELQFISPLPDNLKCIICKGVLVNSYFSPCGCTYCFECIEHYLCNGDRSCPGDRDECIDTLLNFKKDIAKDITRNIAISYLIVRCPRTDCNHTCQMKKLPEHMKSCIDPSTKCAYSIVGCQTTELSAEDMKEHFTTYTVPHAELLVMFLKSSNKKIEGIMDGFDQRLKACITENEKLNDLIGLTLSDISVVRRCQEIQDAAILRLTDDIQKNQDHMDRMQQRLVLSERQQMEMQLRLEKVHQLLEKNEHDKMHLKAEIINELFAKQNGHKTTLVNVVEEHESLSNKVNTLQQLPLDATDHFQSTETVLNQQFNEMKVLSHPLINSQETLSTDESSSIRTVPTDTEFHWRISGIAMKYHRDDMEFSEPFYSGEYKLCLEFRINKLSGLCLMFHLMRGSNDNMLQWPMHRTIEIDIIDQQKSEPVLSRKVCLTTVEERKTASVAAYSRPCSDMNSSGDGFAWDVTYDDLIKESGAIVNDSMLVRCHVIL